MDGHGHASLVGKTLSGRYRIERAIAEGGMGAVYEATQLSLGRSIAVKVLKAADADDAGAQRRFEIEAAAIARLQHPNIVQVLDAGRADDGTMYMALELVEGETVRAALRRASRFSSARALAIAEDVAGGLAAAHAAGVIHRDLKAENVMLVHVAGVKHEAARVLDFGVAKLTSKTVNETGSGFVVGTPGCIAPEQMLGTNDDPRSDLYSLGVLLFEMLTGRPPFVGATGPELMMKHLTEPAPRVRAHVDVAAGLDDLVAALLAKDPDARPKSAEDVAGIVASLRTGTSPVMATHAATSLAQSETTESTSGTPKRGALSPAPSPSPSSSSSHSPSQSSQSSSQSPPSPSPSPSPSPQSPSPQSPSPQSPSLSPQSPSQSPQSPSPQSPQSQSPQSQSPQSPSPQSPSPQSQSQSPQSPSPSPQSQSPQSPSPQSPSPQSPSPQSPSPQSPSQSQSPQSQSPQSQSPQSPSPQSPSQSPSPSPSQSPQSTSQSTSQSPPSPSQSTSTSPQSQSQSPSSPTITMTASAPIAPRRRTRAVAAAVAIVVVGGLGGAGAWFSVWRGERIVPSFDDESMRLWRKTRDAVLSLDDDAARDAARTLAGRERDVPFAYLMLAHVAAIEHAPYVRIDALLDEAAAAAARRSSPIARAPHGELLIRILREPDSDKALALWGEHNKGMMCPDWPLEAVLFATRLAEIDPSARNAPRVEAVLQEARAPNDPAALLALSRARLIADDADGARRFLNDAQRRAPTSPPIVHALVDLDLARGDVDGARARLRALLLARDDIRAQTRLALIDARRGGDAAVRRAAFDKVRARLDAEPDGADRKIDGLANLGNALASLGRFDEANSAWQSAVRAAGDDEPRALELAAFAAMFGAHAGEEKLVKEWMAVVDPRLKRVPATAAWRVRTFALADDVLAELLRDAPNAREVATSFAALEAAQTDKRLLVESMRWQLLNADGKHREALAVARTVRPCWRELMTARSQRALGDPAAAATLQAAISAGSANACGAGDDVVGTMQAVVFFQSARLAADVAARDGDAAGEERARAAADAMWPDADAAIVEAIDERAHAMLAPP